MFVKRFAVRKFVYASRFLSTISRPDLRNVAIIAHVDHGKTTLVDRLLEHSNAIRTDSSSGERVMDSNPLEKERGITIMSKYTSMSWHDKKKNAKFQFNIVDTPGHSDFGGEVERIMKMVDGVAVVIDATEGPMTQTKFVLSKALQHGLLPVVVVNKIDRPSSRLGAVENEIFDLFVTLGANDQQLEYPVIYASAKEGWAVRDLEEAKSVLPHRGSNVQGLPVPELKSKADLNMDPLFSAIVERVPPPPADSKAPFSMIVTQLEMIDHWGKGLIGRILNGKVSVGDSIKALDQDGKVIKEGKVTRIFVRVGMNQTQVSEAGAGEIVSITGLPEASVNSTLCAPSVKQPIKATPVDPPTLAMCFSSNSSPLAGREGEKLYSKEIFARLLKEAETNVSLKCSLNAAQTVMEVRGRGELQLAILIENLRREKFELEISPPEVVIKKGPSGEVLEPFEEVICDLEQKYSGHVMEELQRRGGDLKNFIKLSDGRARLIYIIPARGLIGFGAELRVETGGSAVFNHTFLEYKKMTGKVVRNPKGALISMEAGQATAYALSDIEARGTLFVVPGDECYPGMILGENSRGGDITVNPARAKKLSNVRSTGAADKLRLSPPVIMTLEKAIAYVRDDEVIEVTPTSIRLRKRDKSKDKDKDKGKGKKP